jgi:hypothetical protein
MNHIWNAIYQLFVVSLLIASIYIFVTIIVPLASGVLRFILIALNSISRSLIF